MSFVLGRAVVGPSEQKNFGYAISFITQTTTMKKIIFLISFSLFALNARSQDFDLRMIPFKNDVPYFERVVELDSSYTKEALYANAKKWFIQIFPDLREVIQLDDKDGGEIIGKGILPIHWHYIGAEKNYQKFTIAISLKNGKYRFRIYDVTYPDFSYERFYNWALKGRKQALNFFEGIYNANDIFIASLLQEMKRKPVQDW